MSGNEEESHTNSATQLVMNVNDGNELTMELETVKKEIRVVNEKVENLNAMNKFDYLLLVANVVLCLFVCLLLCVSLILALSN